MIWTALALGFLGSFHCVGMCGPIAFALPLGGASKGKFFFGRIIYNLGRILTYSIFGALFGLLGSAINLAGMQQGISVAAGISILVIALFPSSLVQKILSTNYFSGIVLKLKSSLAHFLRQKNFFAMFLIGVLNGLLPCGFVYLAAAASVTTGSIFAGMGYMALFGFGTAPVMIALTFAKGLLTANSRVMIKKILPLGTAVIALLFILRGLALGIPYISPKLDSAKPATSVCCHPK